MKLTNKQFDRCKCKGCEWLRKVDEGHYICLVPGCMKRK
jgi:hypothetical protein